MSAGVLHQVLHPAGLELQCHPGGLKHRLFAAQRLHRFDGGGASSGDKAGYCGRCRGASPCLDFAF